MLLNNAWVATGQQQPGGSGCVTAISHIEYYPNGEIASKDDFNGQRICYAYDGLNREISRVEGIPNTSICSEVLASNVSLPANARMTTTEWHPEWRLPTKVVAPGSITSSIYHGQPDPFNSNAVINCTSAANLPNGKSLPLLCKQVIQATLANGSADTTVPNTGTQYAYDANGKTLTAKDSLNRITGYSYYAATAFTGAAPSEVGVTKGDLQSITNPAGMVTTFDRYDRVGRLLQSTDPKGVVTQVSYGPRGWVNTVSTTAPGQSARTTTYTYDAMGQVRGVQSPDGSSVSYTYDAAHRLTRVSDARGNSVTYTLDNAGNRIGESMKDPQDVLLRVISRSFDALNRLQQVSGAVQ
jgi:YD repeat-containing protein